MLEYEFETDRKTDGRRWLRTKLGQSSRAASSVSPSRRPPTATAAAGSSWGSTAERYRSGTWDTAATQGRFVPGMEYSERQQDVAQEMEANLATAD